MPKKPESLVRSEKFSNVERCQVILIIFWYTKKTKTVRPRPDLISKFLSILGPKPGSKSPAQFTTLTYVVFKFAGLSLYVQYFTQKVIQ